jgi:chromatin structure-remodeling complex subunit RSC1/2
MIPPNGSLHPNTTNFASIPAGPGSARSAHETNLDLKAGAKEEDVGFGILTYRVGIRDRIFTDEARHKGQSYKVGKWDLCLMTMPARRGLKMIRRLRSLD